MAEYIERENAYKLISEQKEKETGMYSIGRNTGLNIAKSIIHSKEQCPSADVVEVRHGYWFITEYEYFTCSECGNSYYNGCESTAEAKQRMKDGFYDNYCGHCGAKMDGKGDNDGQ